MYLDDVKKNAYREIIVIAVPSILQVLVTTFSSIIDSKMVSAIGIKAISAISVTNQPRLIALSLFFAINTVTSSLVAKYLGEKKQELANAVFNRMIRIVIVLSIILSVLLIAFARPILYAFANQLDTLDDSVSYFKIVMAGTIFNTIYIVINAAYIGFGKTNVIFISGLIDCIFNLTFNYLLIEGRCGFPALCIRGAAIATVIGYFAAMVYCIISLFDKENFINIQGIVQNNIKLSKEMYCEITALTKSSLAERVSQRLSLFFIGAIVARIGSFQMAVYTICMHLMNINFAFGSGSQTATVALVGRSYGEKDVNAIKIYKDSVVKFTIIYSVIIAFIIILSRKWYIGLFSKDEEFLREGTVSCIIIGMITIFQSLKFAYNGCLIGLGDLKSVLHASVVGFSLINIMFLIIFVLIMKKGLYGVWIASMATQVAQCIMTYYYVNKDINKLNGGLDNEY